VPARILDPRFDPRPGILAGAGAFYRFPIGEPTVWSALKNRWHELAEEPAGRRFQNRFRRKQKEGHGSLRIVGMIVGILFIAGGIVLLVIPGPGTVLLIIGAAFLAETSEVSARVLDRLELKLRTFGEWALDRWRRTGMIARSALVISTVAVAGTAAWLAYSYFLR